jgi:hypothetical protein
MNCDKCNRNMTTKAGKDIVGVNFNLKWADEEGKEEWMELYSDMFKDGKPVDISICFKCFIETFLKGKKSMLGSAAPWE